MLIINIRSSSSRLRELSKTKRKISHAYYVSSSHDNDNRLRRYMTKMEEVRSVLQSHNEECNVLLFVLENRLHSVL